MTRFFTLLCFAVPLIAQLSDAKKEEFLRTAQVARTKEEALFERRDQIVKLFDDKIAAQGEAAVLFNEP